MKVHRPGAGRGQHRSGWLDSRHGFSFGGYHDPQWMGWGALRVLNEDRVAAGAGFPPHGHANMEILSYVLEGALAHRDSSGGEGVLRAGEWQWMSAGRGVEHSEFNASATEPVHFLQVWIQPDRSNAEPAHAQRAFDVAGRNGEWVLHASPDGAEGSLPIRQQAWVHGIALAAGGAAAHAMASGRRYWLQVTRGEVEVDGVRLAAGDGLGLVDEAGALHLLGGAVAGAELVLFDLPA